MKKITLASAALALALASQAQAAAGDWMIRARALGVISQEGSTISPASVGGKADIDNSLVPEVDFTYFFTDNIAAELIAAVTPHDVTAKGTSLGDVDAGSAWLLPPTLTLQYHITGIEGVKPYVGAGVNYTVFFNEDGGALDPVSYDDGFGWALQAGVDIPVESNWYVNLDVKKIFLNTDAKFSGGVVADVDIDPLLVGAGVGYRF